MSRNLNILKKELLQNSGIILTSLGISSSLIILGSLIINLKGSKGIESFWDADFIGFLLYFTGFLLLIFTIAIPGSVSFTDEEKDNVFSLIYLLPNGLNRLSKIKFIAALIKAYIIYIVGLYFSFFIIFLFFNKSDFFFYQWIGFPLVYIITHFAHIFSLEYKNGLLSMFISIIICIFFILFYLFFVCANFYAEVSKIFFFLILFLLIFEFLLYNKLIINNNTIFIFIYRFFVLIFIVLFSIAIMIFVQSFLIHKFIKKEPETIELCRGTDKGKGIIYTSWGNLYHLDINKAKLTLKSPSLRIHNPFFDRDYVISENGKYAYEITPNYFMLFGPPYLYKRYLDDDNFIYVDNIFYMPHPLRFNISSIDIETGNNLTNITIENKMNTKYYYCLLKSLRYNLIHYQNNILLYNNNINVFQYIKIKNELMNFMVSKMINKDIIVFVKDSKYTYRQEILLYSLRQQKILKTFNIINYNNIILYNNKILISGPSKISLYNINETRLIKDVKSKEIFKLNTLIRKLGNDIVIYDLNLNIVNNIDNICHIKNPVLYNFNRINRAQIDNIFVVEINKEKKVYDYYLYDKEKNNLYNIFKSYNFYFIEISNGKKYIAFFNEYDSLPIKVIDLTGNVIAEISPQYSTPYWFGNRYLILKRKNEDFGKSIDYFDIKDKQIKTININKIN